jgi:hypothetical protein
MVPLLVNRRIMYSAMFFTLAMLIVLISRPIPVFDEHGAPQRFGLGPHKTPFALGVVTVLIAVISFYVFMLIDILFGE